MKRIVLGVLTCVSVLSIPYFASSIGPLKASQITTRTDSSLYSSIDFGKDAPSRDVFDKALRGFENLKKAGRICVGCETLTLCDFSRSSNQERMWIIDLQDKKVLMHTYVAHGQGSGEEFASAFSNTENSHQSSLGFYVTGDTYMGEHGKSLRLHGMDESFNSAAFDRGIVVHGAEYVSQKFISGNQRLGRSWGCPAVSSALSGKIIDLIKNGTCLFIYYPMKKYLSASRWLQEPRA